MAFMVESYAHRDALPVEPGSADASGVPVARDDIGVRATVRAAVATRYFAAAALAEDGIGSRRFASNFANSCAGTARLK